MPLSFFFRYRVVLSSLRQGTLVLGATLMPSSIFRASEPGAELVKKKKKKGGGGLSWSRCAPTSVMLIRFSVIVNTSKGQLHSVHWASSDLGQTQFEQIVLTCFSWGPVHFFPNSSSVYCQHGTMQTASWMLADFLTMTPFWTRRFMHNVDSCILQIAYFFSTQTCIIAGHSFACFFRCLRLLSLVVCDQQIQLCVYGAFLHKTCTTFFFFSELFTLPNSYLQCTTGTIVAQSEMLYYKGTLLKC